MPTEKIISKNKLKSNYELSVLTTERRDFAYKIKLKRGSEYLQKIKRYIYSAKVNNRGIIMSNFFYNLILGKKI